MEELSASTESFLGSRVVRNLLCVVSERSGTYTSTARLFKCRSNGSIHTVYRFVFKRGEDGQRKRESSLTVRVNDEEGATGPPLRYVDVQVTPLRCLLDPVGCRRSRAENGERNAANGSLLGCLW